MNQYALVGDIGGTNARFALVRPGSVALEQIHTLPCADFANIDEACRAYFDLVGVNGVDDACLALACPVDGDEIQVTNNHWHFHRHPLAEQLGLTRLKLVNDFTAMALGMLHVSEDECLPLGGDASTAGRVRLVMGPGTGLGVGGLVLSQNHWVPLSTEGGHISFAPVDEVDVLIWRHLTEEFGRVSVERILCGQGLVNLYRALCAIRQHVSVCQTPADVSQHAVADSDVVAVETLQRFCRILGTVAGDQVLTLGARGGVYLCGGILPRIRDFLVASDFRRGFENKGRFMAYMQAVPVWLCLAENPGLLGSAAALMNDEAVG